MCITKKTKKNLTNKKNPTGLIIESHLKPAFIYHIKEFFKHAAVGVACCFFSIFCNVVCVKIVLQIEQQFQNL